MNRGESQSCVGESTKEGGSSGCSNEGAQAEQDQPFISKRVMKEMISSYLLLNNKLMDKVCELQEELETKNNAELHNSFHEDYSIMNTDFNEIEEHIKQYKLSLTTYQQQLQAQIQQKNEAIFKLSEQVANLTSKLQQQSQFIQQLEIKNAALEETKDSLLAELQQMEIELRRAQIATSSKVSKISKRNSQAYDSYACFPRDFSESVQVELEKLINKLMKELEYEQANKKKMASEIKRLQLDIIHLEKQIIDKNNKIYSLELKAIKNSKSHPNITIASISRTQKHPPLLHHFSFDSSFQNNDTEKTKRKDNKSTNITLAQILSEKGTLKLKQKVYLCIRLIETYIEKVEQNDLTKEEQSSILIQNYNLRQPHLYSIKLIKKNNERGKGSCQSMQAIASNLFETLEAVLQNNKPNNKNAQGDIREKGVILLLSNAKRNKNTKVEDLMVLKQTLEQLINHSDNEKHL